MYLFTNLFSVSFWLHKTAFENGQVINVAHDCIDSAQYNAWPEAGSQNTCITYEWMHLFTHTHAEMWKSWKAAESDIEVEWLHQKQKRMPSLLKWEGNTRRKSKSKKWDQMKVCLVAQNEISVSSLQRPWSFVGSFPNTIPPVSSPPVWPVRLVPCSDGSLLPLPSWVPTSWPSPHNHPGLLSLLP